MGIQGMTNWKFTAFLTIALMLVAGLFSTAMAAANDGHGEMTVAVTGGTNFQDAVAPLPQILLAAETGYTVTFTYEANADMNGGMVQVAIPGDDWKLPKSGVTVTDTAAGNSDSLTAADNTGDRLVFTGPDAALTHIGVKLDADWAGTTEKSLTIAITGGTSAIPRSLQEVPLTGLPYREYTFTTTTKAKDGNFRRLRILDDDETTADVDESKLDPQPKIRVGNVASGRGTIKISPPVYQGETDRHIQMTFTAAGPMYDGGGINSNVVITIPAGLGTAATPFPTAPAPQTQTPNGKQFVSVSRVTGSVQFANPNQRIIADPAAALVTIDITRMEYNSTITVSYRKVDVDPGLSDVDAPFTATSVSGSTATGIVTFDPAANHVRTIAGSGEIKIAPEIVPLDSRQNLVFTYKAATKLVDADLVITQPDETTWPDLELVMGSGNAQADNYVTTSGGGGTLTLDNSAQTITLTDFDLARNSSLTVRISRAMLTNTGTGTDTNAGAYGWGTTLNAGAVTEPMLYIVNVNDDVAFDIVDVDATSTTINNAPHYPAASERNIYFQFTLDTPIKGGKLQFSIPNGWRQPSHTDVKGKARVKLLERNHTGATDVFTDTDGTDTIPGNLVDKYGPDDNVAITASGYQITVSIKALDGTSAVPRLVVIQYGTGTGDMRGMVQRNAQADLEIIGRFSTGISGTLYPADSPVVMRIGNVEAGSGTAMITRPSPPKVEAGSDKNIIRIVYTAAGTMNGGSVRLGTPLEWGSLDERAGAEKNRIQVVASRSIVDQDAIRYGDHNVLVPLMAARHNNTVEFVLSNVKAQKKIGLAQFTVESAGGSSDGLKLLLGEVRPAKHDDADKKEDDPYRLLGRVYNTNMADDTATADAFEDRDGLLRLEVVAGAGGTGEVADPVEIVRTDSGLQDYLDEDGEVMSDRQVHAGDEEIYLVFRYTPVQTIEDGALRFTVPSDWSPPQEESSNVLGYTEISSSGSLGAADFESRTVTIPISSIDSGQNVEIHYGVGSLGAKAPTAKKTSQFPFAVKGTAGTFTSIGSGKINVRSQASGRGVASVATGMMAADDTPTAHAGDMGTITVTYEPIGQIMNGRIKLIVPAGLVGEDGVMSSHITASTGTAKYGGGMSADDLTMYGMTKNDVLVSGVNLDADDMFTFTYEGMMPEAKGDLEFIVAVDGGEGPGEVKEGMPKLDKDNNRVEVKADGSMTVRVIDAKAGSGSVDIAATGSAANMGRVVAGSGGNEVMVTYEAIGEIGEGKKITVTVPAGWSAPLNEAAADEKMGTFTTKHYLKLAADDPDGLRNAGDAVAASTAKAATTDTVNTVMVATVAAGKMVKAGDIVKFTYSNAMAPAATGASDFTTEYDGEGVEGNVTVLVESAEGATALKLDAVADFTIEDGAVTVTVRLIDANGDEATRSTDTVVELNASSGTIASITIPAGQSSGTGEFSATDAARVTLEATVTGLTSDEVEFLADTTTPVIDSVTVGMMVDGALVPSMYAKAMDTVTVVATGTAAQTGTFSATNAAGMGVTGSTMTESDDGGTYTGMFDVVVDQHPDGDYSVTVSLDGTTSDPVTLTIDSTDPVVSDAALGDTEPVMMGDTVTISATLSEAADVTADVSGLNAAEPTLTLEDADGDGPEMVYTGTVEVTAEGDGADMEIGITATDAAGNMGTASITMVTLDNTAPVISDASSGDDTHVMMGDMVTISAMLSEAATVTADVSGLNAAAPMLTLEAGDGSMMYSGMVEVTADGDGEVTITISASDAAGNEAADVDVMVTLDNTAPVISDASRGDDMYVMAGDTVTVSATLSEAADVEANVSGLNAAAPMLTLEAGDGSMMYTGMVEVTAEGDGEVTITIDASDAAGNAAQAAAVTVMLDNTVPEVTEASVTPSPTRNGETVMISATLSEAATVTADVSDLDTTQEMVTLTDDDSDLTYTYSLTISEDNEADNGSRTVTVTATDAAGNSSDAVDATVDLINTIDFTSIIPADISMFHVPLDVTAIDGEEASLSMVSDLYDALGDAVNYLITTDDGSTWNTYLGGESGDAALTADRGIVLVMKTEKTITFTGNAWGDGASMINLKSGNNVVGVPVMDPSISTVSDLMTLAEFDGKITSILADDFAHVVAGGAADVAVRGDAAYFVSTNADASQSVMGDGWSNGGTTSAAPIALFGRKIDNQTPTLFVEGAIVDELTGLAKDGFRIKVKNLSTKAALSTISQGDVAQGYNMTFVDLNAGNAARVGDVLEISADSPNPLIGVQPVRHIVTVDDVKNSRIELEELVAYEIPAETELLRNYPNPFNPETWIPYHLSEDADVSLTIYDATGILVRTIDLGHQIAAKYDTRAKAIYWDGRNRFGEQVASGIYFYSLSAGDFSATRKMVILK